MDLLRDNPELRPFILSNVTLTGTRIGAGAYGNVDEVAISVCGAAKNICSDIPDDDISKASTQFVKECQLMSPLRHPNIVQFLGVCFFEGSRLPALVMERLLTSLHDLLAPETQPPPGTLQPLSFFKLGLKCSVLHNVASGLDYLHHQTPSIIHRDLSARNILLNSRLVGKLADLGVPRMRDAATMTTAPGASVYMPPEAIAPAESNDEKSKYDASIDVFALGVVTIFTVGETFPCDPLAPNYFDDEKGTLVACTELQRRNVYMRNVNTQLRACGQLCVDHPLIRLIQQCLHNRPHKRPDISDVLGLLEEARAGIRDEENERNRVELVQALQNHPRNQNLVQLIDNLVTENAELQQQLQPSTQQLMRKEAELTRAVETSRREQQELQQQLQSSEREKEMLRLQLTRKEAELTRAEETIRSEQQQIQEIRERETELVQAKDRELAQAQQQLRQLRQQEELVQAKDRELAQAQQQLRQQQLASYTCHVSGPGLQSATAKHPTHVRVELTDSSTTVPQKVTAQLELISKATPTSSGRWPWSKKHTKPAVHAAVATTSPSRYEVSYTAISRGQHKLHVRLNDIEINGSPFTMTVYPDPTQLAHPVRVVTGLCCPYGIAFNSHGEMIVSKHGGHQIAIFGIRGQRIRTFGSHGDSPEQMENPAGIAIDGMDNIYVTSDHKLQKFTSSGELIKYVGQEGSKEDEFDVPRAATLHNNQIYVCDRNNHRIQVFDLDLNFIQSIGSHGKGRDEFYAPLDVKFDTDGYMYVAEHGNRRVQVLDRSGHFIRMFGEKGKGKLRGPTALHIVDKHVYVSDCSDHYIVVYETSGQFVTSFGGYGHKEGEFMFPHCITSCADGFIYVCDEDNNRVQIFSLCSYYCH